MRYSRPWARSIRSVAAGTGWTRSSTGSSKRGSRSRPAPTRTRSSSGDRKASNGSQAAQTPAATSSRSTKTGLPRCGRQSRDAPEAIREPPDATGVRRDDGHVAVSHRPCGSTMAAPLGTVSSPAASSSPGGVRGGACARTKRRGLERTRETDPCVKITRWSALFAGPRRFRSGLVPEHSELS